ncbi:hypothetical protein Bbelb_018630 [Branchiostoma belcheri]|nr:hypothetical protein Bbelb_018630 [Branchiostoma belcheri]
MAISPSCSRSGLISRERETRPETCIGLSGTTPRRLPPNSPRLTYPYFGGRRRGVVPDRPMQVSGLVSRSREIRPLREQDGLIAIENLESFATLQMSARMDMNRMLRSSADCSVSAGRPWRAAALDLELRPRLEDAVLQAHIWWRRRSPSHTMRTCGLTMLLSR